MSIKIDIQIDTDVMEEFQKIIRDSPSITQIAFDRALSRRGIRNRIIEEISAAPDPSQIKYPLRWKSERQRKAYFATDGFGAGIPYKRTGGLQKSWKLTANTQSKEGILSLESNAKSAVYVQGDYAQPFHLDTGWPQVADVIAKYDTILTDTLIDVWYSVAG